MLAFIQNHQEIVFPAYSNGYQKDLDTTKAYHIRLFPGNLVDDELTLHIVLTNKDNFNLTISIIFLQKYRSTYHKFPSRTKDM